MEIRPGCVSLLNPAHAETAGKILFCTLCRHEYAMRIYPLHATDRVVIVDATPGHRAAGPIQRIKPGFAADLRKAMCTYDVDLKVQAGTL